MTREEGCEPQFGCVPERHRLPACRSQGPPSFCEGGRLWLGTAFPSWGGAGTLDHPGSLLGGWTVTRGLLSRQRAGPCKVGLSGRPFCFPKSGGQSPPWPFLPGGSGQQRRHGLLPPLLGRASAYASLPSHAEPCDSGSLGVEGFEARAVGTCGGRVLHSCPALHPLLSHMGAEAVLGLVLRAPCSCALAAVPDR